MKQISEEVLYARRAGASHTVSGELANLDNLKECNCSALAHRVGELEKRNEELENKKVDLYEILLDSFIEILKQHGVTEVCILNEFTRSIENQCQQALPPADKEEVCGCGCRGIHHDLEKAKNVCEQCGNKIKEDSNA